jgi:hypothetical protein
MRTNLFIRGRKPETQRRFESAHEQPELVRSNNPIKLLINILMASG